MVTESPRLSLTYLLELRLELNACLTLLRDDSRCEGGDKHEASSILAPPTRSLCAQDPAGPIAPAERTKLLPLVSALLSEARGAAAAGNEDHV